jgi:FAD/FMN-containing dehydrogenase
VTFQQDSRFGALKNLNAQKRGEKMQPLAFAEPGSTADVAAVVKCSVNAGLRFTARNGGHHYEANSLLDGGVVIDLVKLQELKVNKQDNTAVIGAGQKLVRGPARDGMDSQCGPANTALLG